MHYFLFPIKLYFLNLIIILTSQEEKYLILNHTYTNNETLKVWHLRLPQIGVQKLWWLSKLSKHLESAKFGWQSCGNKIFRNSPICLLQILAQNKAYKGRWKKERNFYLNILKLQNGWRFMGRKHLFSLNPVQHNLYLLPHSHLTGYSSHKLGFLPLNWE